ncbi:TraV family lipoprotein [Burkholderia vietnamiensis]|uniref:TraV family lipoprotein n=1 Tax=Burkholderia vietnamiensis TaxID=60552 RepID=UPI001D13CA5C|nr:TraV family lipoprotein [Burkholderia vietnamiensis]UEC01775.1 TraV family lipoprotein [Burkholderia vietnamiensis]
MTNRLPRAGAMLLFLPLAACVNMSGLDGDSKYACAAPEGVACDSVAGTYENSIRNNLPSQQRRKASDSGAESSRHAADQPGKASPRQPSVALIAPDADTPQPQALRSQARYLRLWIKPWEDADGDLFDQTHIYVQIDNGRWQIEHMQQAIRDRYTPLRPPPAMASGSGTDTPADLTSALPTPIQRPSGAPGFPMLNNPPSIPVGRPAGSPQ